MEQAVALKITLTIISALAAIFLFVVFNSGVKTKDENLSQRGYRLRSRLFIAATALVAPVLIYTLADLPYARANTQVDPFEVRAIGHQWSWEISPQEVPARRPILFNVSSADVNHGFGIYDSSMRLVAQTQAMPGYVNRLVYTFEQPGIYKVLCLEYCGSAHHVMSGEVRVVAVDGRGMQQ